jgi:hypothetical protein
MQEIYCPTCSDLLYTSINVIKYLSYFFHQQGNDCYLLIVDDILCDQCLISMYNSGSSKKDM